jgi:outer membrane protein assembly factor BamD (BamD/ComL family)
MSTSPRAAMVIAATLLAATPFVACSHKEESSESTHASGADGKSPSALLEAATAAMGSDEWKEALAKFDQLLADSKATAEEKAEGWQGKVVCEGHVNGDDGAIAALAKLTDAKVDLAAKQYAKMGNDLSDANKLKAALAVIERATEKFKGDPNAKKLFGKLAKNLAKKLAAEGDNASVAKLGALGYLGASSEDDN